MPRPRSLFLQVLFSWPSFDCVLSRECLRIRARGVDHSVFRKDKAANGTSTDRPSPRRADQPRARKGVSGRAMHAEFQQSFRTPDCHDPGGPVHGQEGERGYSRVVSPLSYGRGLRRSKAVPAGTGDPADGFFSAEDEEHHRGES